MSRQLGSLHRSNSHPTNLNTPITIIPLFAFPPPDFPNNKTLIHITQFYTQSHNSIIQILKPLMNLPTQNHLHPIIFKPIPQFFRNPLFNQSHHITHSHPFLHPPMLHKLPQPTLHFIQIDHPILQTPPKFPKN